MTDGLTLTLVGMLFVFAFLIVLVVAMRVLHLFARRFAKGTPPDPVIVAAAAAALRRRSPRLFSGNHEAGNKA